MIAKELIIYTKATGIVRRIDSSVAVRKRRQKLGVFLGCDRDLTLSELIALRRAIDLEIEKKLRHEKQDD